MKKTLRIAVLLAALMPLASVAQLIGTYHFDENGSWSWSGGGSGLVTQQIPGGGVQYDITAIGHPFDSVLIGQTFGFNEPGSPWNLANLSDVIHFDNAMHFSYYSDIGDPDLADLLTQNLQDFVASKGWTIPVANQYFEVGPEGNNYISFSTVVEGVGTVEYFGISDVPEPATLALMAIGAMAMLWRKRS